MTSSGTYNFSTSNSDAVVGAYGRSNHAGFVAARKTSIAGLERLLALSPLPMGRFTVYAAINRETGHAYVGITSRALSERSRRHFYVAETNRLDTHFARAIRKYGRGSFSFHSIALCRTKEEAYGEERRSIEDYRPEYNSTSGGEGVIGLRMSLGARQKMRAAKLRNPDRQAIAKRAAMTLARPVLCLTDMAVHESTVAAGYAYDLSHTQIRNLCRTGKRSRRGLAFKFYEAVQ